MPTNRIACVSHMLVDERVIPLLVKAAEAFPASKRPAGLDHQKATSSSRSSTLYAEAYKQYRTWQKEYINPFTEGQFSEDLKGIQFKDGDEIRKLVVQVVSRVETIKKNHQQSGHHSSGDERLEEICSSFLSP